MFLESKHVIVTFDHQSAIAGSSWSKPSPERTGLMGVIFEVKSKIANCSVVDTQQWLKNEFDGDTEESMVFLCCKRGQPAWTMSATSRLLPLHIAIWASDLGCSKWFRFLKIII